MIEKNLVVSDLEKNFILQFQLLYRFFKGLKKSFDLRKKTTTAFEEEEVR